MPQTSPFTAIRYNLDHVGSISNVIAPPYDVIDPALQDQLYKLHPANVIRIILNRPEPGDTGDEKYQRAAKFVQQWLEEGVLKRDETPAFYVYHQRFDVDGQTFNRRGFMGRVRLQRFGEGNIYPHEETHPKAKVDRLKLTTATKQNNSQIFGLYPDPNNEVITLLDEATKGVTPIEATDHLGVTHLLWPVTDEAVAAKVERVDERQADVRCRWTPPLRDGLQLPRSADRAERQHLGRSSRKLCDDDVGRDERSRDDRASDSSTAPRHTEIHIR